MQKNKLKYVTILMFSTAATGITHHQHRCCRHMCVCEDLHNTHVTTRQNSFKQLLLWDWIFTTTNKSVSLSFSTPLLIFLFSFNVSFGRVCVGYIVID